MTKRILTIDGGGIRGVFSAAIIEQMEKVYGGKPACEIFDCFVGTSAGSVLAAGLAAGKSATELKQVFLQLGAMMSNAMQGGRALEKDPAELAAARSKATASLSEALKGLFGEDLYPNQLKKRFTAVTRNMELGRVVFFGNFPRDEVEGDSFWDEVVDESDIPVWKMVLRSAALPPIFQPTDEYLDGGISPFANPSYAAYVGVQRRLGWNPYKESLKFFSVGTGYHNVPKKISEMNDTRLFSTMVSSMIQDINFLQHQVMKRQRDLGNIWYKRYNMSFDRSGFEKMGIQEIPSPEELAELASTSSPKVEKLAEIGTRVGKALVDIEDFADAEGPADRRVSGGSSQPAPDKRILPSRIYSAVP